MVLKSRIRGYTLHTIPQRVAMQEPSTTFCYRVFTNIPPSRRIVLSHCDLTPRNILVQDGKIQGLVDWENSGWFPKYWEYVRFFQRSADKDWKLYAEIIFPELCHDELVDFMAISKWQNA